MGQNAIGKTIRVFAAVILGYFPPNYLMSRKIYLLVKV